MFITKTRPCNMVFFSPVKTENFIRKKLIFFLILLKTEIMGTNGSNEYPQSMFWSKNKKKRYTPAYPSFAT